MCFVKERAAATVAATAHSAALADERAAAAARCAAIEARLEAETKRVRKLTAQRDAADGGQEGLQWHRLHRAQSEALVAARALAGGLRLVTGDPRRWRAREARAERIDERVVSIGGGHARRAFPDSS